MTNEVEILVEGASKNTNNLLKGIDEVIGKYEKELGVAVQELIVDRIDVSSVSEHSWTTTAIHVTQEIR